MSKLFINELMNYQNVVIYTPYETSGGFANSLLHELNEQHFKGNIYIKAVPLKFISHASVYEQLDACGLLPNQIAAFIKNLKK